MTAPDDPMSLPRDRRPVAAARLSLAEVADLGLDAAELRRLTSMTPDQIRRRNAMSRLASLDPARLEEDFALDLATALLCAECSATGACQMAVAEGRLPADARFCANQETFKSLAAE